MRAEAVQDAPSVLPLAPSLHCTVYPFILVPMGDLPQTLILVLVTPGKGSFIGRNYKVFTRRSVH